MHVDFQFSGNTDLKIYGMCPQVHTYVRTYVCIHTHLHNAVPLMWGSLRLAPINSWNIVIEWATGDLPSSLAWQSDPPRTRQQQEHGMPSQSACWNREREYVSLENTGSISVNNTIAYSITWSLIINLSQRVITKSGRRVKKNQPQTWK